MPLWMIQGAESTRTRLAFETDAEAILSDTSPPSRLALGWRATMRVHFTA